MTILVKHIFVRIFEKQKLVHVLGEWQAFSSDQCLSLTKSRTNIKFCSNIGKMYCLSYQYTSRSYHKIDVKNSEPILRSILVQNFRRTNMIIKIGTRMYCKTPISYHTNICTNIENDEIYVWKMIELLVQTYAMNLNMVYQNNDWIEIKRNRLWCQQQ